MHIQFVDDADVPTNKPTGRLPHPVDRNFAAGLREKPGRWAKYPLKDRYPDRDPLDRDEYDRMVHLVRKRITTPTAAFRTTQGRYETRTDPTAGVLLVRFTQEG